MSESPSEEYLNIIEMLDSVVQDCVTLSRRLGGIPSPTSAHYYASTLFTSLSTRGVSLGVLSPYTQWASKAVEHWDYASLAGLVRSILEIRLAFYYLCIEKIPRVELECR